MAKEIRCKRREIVNYGFGSWYVSAPFPNENETLTGNYVEIDGSIHIEVKKEKVFMIKTYRPSLLDRFWGFIFRKEVKETQQEELFRDEEVFLVREDEIFFQEIEHFKCS